MFCFPMGVFVGGVFATNKGVRLWEFENSFQSGGRKRKQKRWHSPTFSSLQAIRQQLCCAVHWLLHKVPVCVFLYCICVPSPACTLLNWRFRGAVGLFAGLRGSKRGACPATPFTGPFKCRPPLSSTADGCLSTRWHTVSHSGWFEFQGVPFYGVIEVLLYTECELVKLR